MSERPTVFLVDDDASIRRTLPVAIRSPAYDVIAYESAEAFLAAYNGEKPGCLVLDLRMPAMSGLALQTEISRRAWSIPIIFLSAYGTVDAATRAMKAGAVYFLEKPVEPPQLIARIAEAVALDASQRLARLRQDNVGERIARLTRRQRHVLDLVVQGLTSKQIAESLGRSVKTVEVHRSQILRRMDVRGVAELINLVLASGLPPRLPAAPEGNGRSARRQGHNPAGKSN